MLKTAEELIQDITRITSPQLMKKQEALDFMSEIADSLEANIEVLREELENEE